MELEDDQVLMVGVEVESIDLNEALGVEEGEWLRSLYHPLLPPQLPAKFAHREVAGGEIASAKRVHLPVRALAVASPDVPGGEVVATFSLSGVRSAGLAIRLGWFGAKAGLKLTLRQDFTLTSREGTAKVLSLLLPFTHEVRMVTPLGGAEKFPIDHLVPVPNLRQVGAEQRTIEVGELLRNVVEEAPWKTDDGGLESSTSSEISVSSKLDLSLRLSKDSSIGVSGTIEGSVGTSIRFKVPRGDFSLKWLTDPAGAALLPTT